MINCETKWVGITGVHAGCYRTPGMAVSKCLSNCHEYNLIALDYDGLSTGLYSDLYNHKHILPWVGNKAAIVNELQVLKTQKKLDILIPCLNADVEFFRSISDELSQIGIDTFLPSIGAVNSRKKAILPELSNTLKLNSPVTAICNNFDEIFQASKKIGFPCLVKGKECGVFPVRNEELLRHFSDYCAVLHGWPIILQEWIAGEEYSIYGLSDSNSNLKSLLAVKKIGITDDGETWMSVTVAYDEYHEIVNTLIKALNWFGPIEIDLIRDDIGKLYLIDINPRFPAWIDGLLHYDINPPLNALRFKKLETNDIDEKAPEGIVLQKDFVDIYFDISNLLPEAFTLEATDARKNGDFAYRRI